MPTIDEISYKLGKLQEGIRELQRDIEELKKKADSSMAHNAYNPSILSDPFMVNFFNSGSPKPLEPLDWGGI